VSALGIRMLELFMDPAVFGALHPAQRSVFMVADVLFTAAVLGDGGTGEETEGPSQERFAHRPHCPIR
jgi:hypothetical protein